VLQGVHSNYEIDLFQKLLQAAAGLAGINDLSQSSLRVIADHIRSCAFLIADGVMPSNEGRGYVVRRIIRRAIRHGYRLGIRDVFFYKLVAPLAEEMGAAFPELKAAQAQVERVLKKEEERFAETLEQGMKTLEACVAKMEGSVIPGETVFQLYDTYGFPVDLTADFARENHLSVDHAGFEMAMSAQRDRARSASSFGADYDQDIKLNAQTEFTGYEQLDDQVYIIGLYKKGQPVTSLQDGEEGIVILDKTPFYAESGGQIGDCGKIEADGAVFEVTDTQKQGGNLFLHKGKLISGTLTNGQLCDARVSAADRKATELNHSATHLLHAALRQVLGDHVAQKGSLVNPERLRFDFSHFEPVTAFEISTVEWIVNEQIRANNPVISQVMAKDDAVKAGAMALFGEKYGDEVRVLKIGEFSTELCGGTHVERAGDIGCFKIINETGVAAGVRRIEAVTGGGCIDFIAGRDQALASIAGLVKSAPEKAPEKVEQLMEKNRFLEKQLERLNAKLASSAGSELSAQAIDVEGIKVLAVKLDGVDPKSLKDMIDQLKNKLASAAIVLAVVEGDKVSLIAGVTKDQIERIKAGDLVNFVATKVGGKGGGRPDMAQAGGNDPSGLADALAHVPAWVRTQLGV
jgi:alanyl-tRNA synthetase